jgi:hypothetical protein
MPRKPSHIVFVCEACRRQASPRNLRSWSGRCQRCKSDASWTLVVNYTESDTELSLLGTLSTMIFGLGWFSTKAYTNQMTASGISADVARYLTEKRSLVAPRVVEYIRLREQQNLQQRGAQSCKVCDARYVPSDEKPWSQEGYCSKVCATKDGAAFTVETDTSPGRKPRAHTIAVVCPQGHAFEVLESFAGCIRPCTECGAKTAVP